MHRFWCWDIDSRSRSQTQDDDVDDEQYVFSWGALWVDVLG